MATGGRATAGTGSTADTASGTAGVGSTTGTAPADGTRSDAGPRRRATGVASTAATGSGAAGVAATIGTRSALGSVLDVEAERPGLGTGVGSGADAVSSVGAGVTSVLGSGAGARFGAEGKPLVETGVVLRLGGNAGAVLRPGFGVAVGPGAAWTAAVGSVDVLVALLVASPRGGGSMTSDANATPAGMAAIAEAKAQSSTRAAVRTVCAGRDLAGWERPAASGLNSLERQDPTLPSASNCSEPPGAS